MRYHSLPSLLKCSGERITDRYTIAINARKTSSCRRFPGSSTGSLDYLPHNEIIVSWEGYVSRRTRKRPVAVVFITMDC